MITRFNLGPNFGPARDEDWLALDELAKEAAGGNYIERYRIRLSFGTQVRVVAHECRHCGAPLGSIDPDDPSVDEVVLGKCSDCRDLF